jgi:sugar lactone lactonase YvrE
LDDSFVFGGKHGIGIAKKETNEYRYIQKFWTREEVEAGNEFRMRANDGTVDSQGRYWVSTLNDPLVTGPAPVGMRALRLVSSYICSSGVHHFL